MWPRELQQIVDDLVQRIDALDDFADDAVLRAAVGKPATENLHGAPDPGERVPHLVRDHRRHLAELGQGGLFAKAASCCLRSVMS